MSKSLNRCEFIGNLTKDVDMRYTGDGRAIANFSIACNDSYKKDGQTIEATEFVNIVAFGKLGEICGSYLSKGSKVYVAGKMKTDKYEKDGVTKYSTKVSINEMIMLDGAGRATQGQQAQSEPQGGDFSDDLPDFL
jgi:single-strand DNA-binding protein